jgi:hypothetical protein
MKAIYVEHDKSIEPKQLKKRYSINNEKRLLKNALDKCDIYEMNGKQWVEAKELFKYYCQAFIGCARDYWRILNYKKLDFGNDYLIEGKDYYLMNGNEKKLFIDTNVLYEKFIFNKNHYEEFDPHNLGKVDGKIYKIWSRKTKKLYIGSTCQTLHARFVGHECGYENYKKYNRSCPMSRDILKYSDAVIELVETFKCSDGTQLKDRERYWIRAYKDKAVNVYDV